MYRSNNAGLEPVTPAESVCAGVCQQALGFCTDKDGDGVIELGEGCLVVSGCCCSMLVACWSAGTCFGQPTVTGYVSAPCLQPIGSRPYNLHGVRGDGVIVGAAPVRLIAILVWVSCQSSPQPHHWWVGEGCAAWLLVACIVLLSRAAVPVLIKSNTLPIPCYSNP